MEDLFSYIGYALVALFWLLPRLLKGVLKKKAGQSFEGQTIELPEEEQVQYTQRPELEKMLSSAKQLDARCESMLRKGAIHDAVENLTESIRSNGLNRIQALCDNLSSRLERNVMPPVTEAAQIQRHLNQLEQMTAIFEQMVTHRTAPATAKILERLDDVAQDCLAPYVVHARRVGLKYPTRQAVTILGVPGMDSSSLFDEADIAPVIVDRKKAESVAGWPHIASDVAMDVYFATRGLASEISSGLGIRPTHFSFYGSDEQLFLSLLDAWLPRAFADVAATLQLGPGFTSGLFTWIRPLSVDKLTEVRIDPQTEQLTMPLVLRFYVACRTLQHLGLKQEGADRWKECLDKTREVSDITIHDSDGNTRTLSAAKFQSVMTRVVEYVVENPHRALGGYSLGNLPGLATTQHNLHQIELGVQQLKNGNQVDASGRIILASALVSAYKNATFHSQISRAAIASFTNMGQNAEMTYAQSTIPDDLPSILSSPEFLVKAIVTGAAIAPARSK